MSKLSIKIKAYEAKLVDDTSKKIVALAKQNNTKVSGPVPLPTKRELFTVLRSTHVNKKSREQFEIKTHQRLIVLTDVDSKLAESLKRMTISAGVEVNIKEK
ncbi:MAG: 30S ribosomal protein S10 [Mollicutes bacterium PWAP]|nr:30S ribosomal protein S10 [Mollicutes bacterium PWAP]